MIARGEWAFARQASLSTFMPCLGQILARYHADEVRDSRAQYRATLAELDRAKSAAAQAQRNLNRVQRLLELKAGSVQQVELAHED